MMRPVLRWYLGLLTLFSIVGNQSNFFFPAASCSDSTESPPESLDVGKAQSPEGDGGRGEVASEKPTVSVVREVEVMQFGDSHSLDMDRVPVNTDLVLNLRLVNRTGSGIQVMKVEADCGCIVAAQEGPVIEAGDSWELEAKIRASARIGGLLHQLQVFFQDHGAMPVRVNLIGRYTGSLEIEDSQLAFGPSEKEKLLQVKAFDGVKILDVSSRTAFLEVESWQQEGNRVVVGLSPRASFGNGLERLAFKLEKDGKVSIEELLLRFELPSAIKISPSEIVLESDGENISLRVLLVESEPGTLQLDQMTVSFSGESPSFEIPLGKGEIKLKRISNRLVELQVATERDVSKCKLLTVRNGESGAYSATVIQSIKEVSK